MPAFLSELPVDLNDGVAPLSDRRFDILAVGVFQKARKLICKRLELFPLRDTGGHGVCRRLQQLDFCKALGVHQRLEREAALTKKRIRGGDGVQYPRNQFFLINGGIGSCAALDVCGIVRQRLSQRFDDADIVHDQTVALALRDAIGAGDGLHERVRLERLVQIETGKTLDVKAGQPHGADEHDAERIFGVLELLIQLSLFHLLAVRFDIQPPFLERLDLILLLTDDDRHLRFTHPCELALQLLDFLLLHRPDLRFEPFDFLRPVLLHKVIHPHAGHFIEAYEHRLTARPEIGVVADKVLRDGVKARLRGQQMDFLGELAFQLVLLVDVQIRLLDGVEDAVGDLRVVQVFDLVATVFVVQRHRRAVVHGALEVVNGYVAAEGALGDIVVGKQRRTGKADAGGGRQQRHHVVGKNAVLAAVRLVRHDDNVVVGIDRRGVRLVELLDQREDEAGIAAQLVD